MLNGVRVVPLPKGGLELIQDYVGNILGLATKSIFEDVMATTIYSFISDLIKNKQIKLHGGERSEEELFKLMQDIGFGHFNEMSKDVDSYSVTIEKCFNSFFGITKTMNYCFQANGILTAIYRLVLGKDVKANELRCKTTGNADIDWFEVKVIGDRSDYVHVDSPVYDLSELDFEQIQINGSESGTLINSIPVEVVPVTFFPYLFSKLRKIIGMGVYGIQYGIGTALSKLYLPYPLTDIATKYQVNGLEVLSPLAGVGLVQAIKNDFGGLKEVDIYDSFNSLHIDNEVEKRCFLLSGVLAGLSYSLLGTNLKIKELDCAAINNSICKFAFD